MMILLAVGCGLKGNPASTLETHDEQKISAYFQEGAVLLTWSDPETDYSHTIVEKSELGSVGNVCKGCPRTYVKMADLPKDVENRFVDASVTKGKSYSYRLKICDETENCTLSQTKEIELK